MATKARKTVRKSAKKASKGAAAKPAAEKPTLSLTRRLMIDLYQARQYLSLKTLKDSGVRMPVEVYFKDPAVAKEIAAFDDDFTTPWEPGLGDGPTSARFAVVDYDSTNNVLTPPAEWDETNNRYVAPDGTVLNGSTKDLYQYHQLSVWAIVQNTLDFFESGFGLGRRISWAFEGNRLIVVPHAGYGENAYYDRASKSLQLYWFKTEQGTVYTCLSSDIVNHEFGHAVLDGLRPHYYDSIAAEPAAFHEFLGDLTALLMAFSNNAFRKIVLKESNGKLTDDKLLSALAEEFGRAAQGTDYLRTAQNCKTMAKLAGDLEPHNLSEVMTGAMFDILKGIFAKHQKREIERAKREGKGAPSDIRALADTVPRMQMIAIQPLDLLPPCAVTFRDYALAVLRSEQISNPTDPSGYRQLMIDCFIQRGILQESDREGLMEPVAVFKRLQLQVFHSVESIAASRGGAYRFLDDNRAALKIPFAADVTVSEIVRARKLTRDRLPMPEQVVIQYIWREELLLEGPQFGQFAGERTTMLCGGTMVLDPNGNLIHWVRKPGTQDVGDAADQADGIKRRDELLTTLAQRIEAGMIGDSIGGELGLVERAAPPFTAERADGVVRFGLSPHFALNGGHEHRDHDDEDEDDEEGNGQWQISF